MSLISDALKKAQAQQQQSSGRSNTTTASDDAQTAPPPPLPAPAAPIVHPDLEPAPTPSSRSKRNGALVIFLLGSLAICLGGGAALLVWGFLGTNATPATAPAEVATISAPPPSAPPEIIADAAPTVATPTPAELPPIVFDLEKPSRATSPVEVAQPTSGRPADPAVAPGVTTATPVAAVPVMALPIAVTPSAEPPPIAASTTVPPTVLVPQTAAPVAPTPRPVAPRPVAPAPPPQNQAALDYLENISVRGVMRGGSKILLYDSTIQRSSAYSPGETINDALGLSIVNISQSQLVLKDYVGATYTKRF